MVCPSCHIMTGRRLRNNVLEDVCRYPKCKRFGQVISRTEMPPASEEEMPIEQAETTDE